MPSSFTYSFYSTLSSALYERPFSLVQVTIPSHYLFLLVCLSVWPHTFHFVCPFEFMPATSSLSPIRSPPQRMPEMSPPPPVGTGKKCLALDLDETLVHSSFQVSSRSLSAILYTVYSLYFMILLQSWHCAELLCMVFGCPYVLQNAVQSSSLPQHATSLLSSHFSDSYFLSSFSLPLPSTQPVDCANYVIPVTIDNVVHNVFVIKRPGVDDFMRRVGEVYEVSQLSLSPLDTFFLHNNFNTFLLQHWLHFVPLLVLSTRSCRMYHEMLLFSLITLALYSYHIISRRWSCTRLPSVSTLIRC